MKNLLWTFLFCSLLVLPAAADREAARKAQLEGNEAFSRGDNEAAIKACSRATSPTGISSVHPGPASCTTPTKRSAALKTRAARP
ncbi:MAG: hypothetical protein AAB074_04695 [Planctomycetota bacterium]